MLSILEKNKFRMIWLFYAAVAAYFFVFGLNAVTRVPNLYYSPDSMNYVDVARNILRGNGVSQSTIGFNQPVFLESDTFPVPLTSQPPLYPLLVALIALLGISPNASGVIVSVFSFGLFLVLIYQVISLLYNKKCGLLTVCLLLFYPPLTSSLGKTSSDPLGLMFLSLSLWVFIKLKYSTSSKLLFSFLAGISVGLAFSVRYALLPLCFLGIFFIALESRRKMFCILFALGFLIPAGLVWYRNFVFIDAVMPTPNPSTVGLIHNMAAFFWALTSEYSNELSRQIQAALFGLFFLVLIALLARRYQLLHALYDLFIDKGKYVLLVWLIIYSTYLIVQRTLTHFDWIDSRLTLPAGIIVTAFAAILLWKAIEIKDCQIDYLALAVVFLLIFQQMKIYLTIPEFNHDQWVTNSERLSWVEHYTTNRDLVIGDDIVDVPFHLGRPVAVSFSPYPYNNYPEYKTIMLFCERNHQTFDNFYLVIRKRYQKEVDWQIAYGSFITDIVFERLDDYSGIKPIVVLQDGYVFQVECTD